jgi:signal transduction histidine kinase/HAMP domain-containing protein
VWQRLRYKLVFLLVTATAIVFALQSWQTIRYVNAAVLDVTEQASVTDINEIRAVLEEQMLAGDHKAFIRLVQVIGQAPGVTWVGIIDANGTAKVTSVQDAPMVRLGEETPERQQLLTWRASGGVQAVTMLKSEGTVLRTLSPLPNAKACQRCHSPGTQANGMLIIDRSLAPLQKTIALSQQHLLMGGAILLALLLGIMGLAVERTVLLRVERLRATTRSLGGGNLSARASDPSLDELGDLARDFDDMAQRLESAMLAVAAQRREFEELVNGISDGVVLLDLEGRVVTVNKACARRIPGEPPEPGTAYRELIRSAGIEVAENALLPAERALASGLLEKEIVWAGNGDRTEELYAQPLRSPDGAMTAVIEVWRDISDRRDLEAGLEQSERLASLGVLASSVAHEVGNPLASIITAVDGLLARLPAAAPGTPDEIRDYLEIVRKQVFRCHTVTQRLLGFARLPSGEDAVVDVAKAAREVLALVKHEARALRVEFEVRAPDVVLATAPDMLLEQVFLNLVLNALKAMPSGGRLVVEVSEAGDGVAASFSDTGPGIPADVGRHLFQPFRRSKQDRNGTGLGLFISQALMARAGGFIEVDSRPGNGTTFIVRLRRLPERLVTQAAERLQGPRT